MSDGFLKGFIGITRADEEALAEVGAVLAEKVGLQRLVEMVYQRLLSYPETARFFETQDLEVRKRTLAAYIGRLLEGGFDSEYAADHTEVGRKHQQADIPFEFLVATYGWVRSLVPGLLLEALGGEPERAVALATSFNKVLDFDLCLLARGYSSSGIPLATV